MAFPAYDQCIKASHFFNLLDARGVISVTERQAYVSRVRVLAKMCADAFLKTDAGSVIK
jgi:glycyl-tRNA synthetase alpha chain